MVDRWNGVQKAFHWVLALLVLGQLYFGFTLGDLPRDAPARAQVFQTHVNFAVMILILMAARLVWRVTHRAPAPLVKGPVGMFGRVVHWVFYAWLIAMAIGTIVAMQALGRPLAFFGIPLPTLTPPNPGLGRAIFSQHATAGVALAVLVGLHVLAALWHHFIRKDNTLLRMLPGVGLRA